VPKDKYGNPNGTNYDLLRDGSMRGYKILIVNLCTASDSPQHKEGYDGPIRALENKGFEVDFSSGVPSNLGVRLSTASQFWLISGSSATLTPEHIATIKSFYNQGRGVYIWGDNDPWYADANALIKALFGVTMEGNYMGDKVIGVQRSRGDSGIIAGHLISTGIANFYEGITIARININQYLLPLVYSSDGKVVTAFSDKDDKRVLIDGGFTRLYCKWDSAGTDRYIVNAAGWLGNFEKFGWNIPN
jgi:hypothetical protein